MASRPWPSDEESRAILERLALWYTLSEIAVLLGRTRISVRKKTWRLGVSIQHWENGSRTWSEAERLYLLYQAGTESQTSFGEKVGRSKYSISWSINRERTSWNRGRISLSAVARLAGCSVTWASMRAKKLWARRKPSRGRGLRCRYDFSYEQAEALMQCIRPGRVSWVRERL